MRVLILGSDPDYLVNFRSDLIRDLIKAGCDVHAGAPAAESRHEAAIRNLGATFVHVDMARNSLTPLRDLKTLRALIRLFRDVRPNAVFAYTVKPVVFGGVAARLAAVPAFYALIPGLGYLFMGHGFRGALRRWLGCALYRVGLAKASAVFVQNKEDAEDLRRAGAIRGGHRVIQLAGSGVDTTRFVPTPLPERPVFLFVARLVREKGVTEFIEAARMLHRVCPSVVCRVVGYFDGGPSDVDPATVEAAHREGVIDFVGRVADVRPELERAAVFVLPSYYREGTPRSALEALAMGRPIITTDWVGCRETVRHGVNGLLVPPRDVEALLGAMTALARDRGLRERMGAESRALACSRFDVRLVNQAILEAMGLPTATCNTPAEAAA